MGIDLILRRYFNYLGNQLRDLAFGELVDLFIDRSAYQFQRGQQLIHRRAASNLQELRKSVGGESEYDIQENVKRRKYMKENHIRRSRLLDKITVDSEYAQAHFEELMNRVCRENIAIIVRDGKGSVVMVPHWWYHLYFNKSAESGGLFLLTDNDSGEK